MYTALVHRHFVHWYTGILYTGTQAVCSLVHRQPKQCQHFQSQLWRPQTGARGSCWAGGGRTRTVLGTFLQNCMWQESLRQSKVVTSFLSHSEYLVIHQVWAAYQQDLVVQGVKCVLYKVWSVYCTSVPCVLYKVCRLYCTRCTVCIIQGVQCEFYIKI